MPLTLITGRANAGKTGHVYSLLDSTVRDGGRAVLLLPSQPEAARAVSEFSRRRSVGLHVDTFDGWLRELWSRHGDGRRLITDSSRLLIVREAMNLGGAGARLKVADSTGVVRLVAVLAGRTAGLQRSPRTPIAAALAQTLAEYDSLLQERDLVEPAEAARRLSLEEHLGADVIVAHRFADLSATQELLLISASRAADVHITLAWAEGFPASEALDPLVSRLDARGTHVRMQSSRDATELGELEDALFRPDVRTCTSRGQLVLGEASGQEAEQSLIADIVAEAVSEGIPAGRIAVVFRDARLRATALAVQLAQRGVEADVDVSMPFSTTEFGRAFLALVDLCTGRKRSTARAHDFLRSPYSGADSRQVSRLDSAWRASRANTSRLVTDVCAAGGTTGEIAGLGIEIARSGVSVESACRLKRLAGLMLWAAQAPGGRGLSVYDTASHRALLGVVNELLGSGQGVLPLVDLAEVVAQRSVASGRADRERAVQITEASRIRSRRFDVVIVGGLTANEFSTQGRDDSVEMRLGELGVPADTEQASVERFLFYLVATRARDRLVLVRQTVDSEGQTLRASTLWDDVREAYGESPGDEESLYRIPRRSRSLSEMALAAPVFSPERQDVRSAAWRRPETDGGLEDPAVLKRLADRREFSVTELETYIGCPRHWFYEYVLSPRELEVSFDSRAGGTVAHGAIAEFYGRWREETGHDRVTPELLEDAIGMVDEVLESASAVRPVGLEEHLARARAHGWVRGVVRADVRFLPRFVPIAHEFVFGEECGKAFDIGKGVLIRGRIDRIDRVSTSIVVTDYKSGQVRGWQSFERAGLVQVPIYAYVASQLLDVAVAGGLYRSLSLGTLRGFWDGDLLDVYTSGSERDRVASKDAEQIMVAALERTRRAALGIRAGLIPAQPGTTSTCAFCPLRPTCKVAR